MATIIAIISVVIWVIGICILGRIEAKRKGKQLEGDDWAPIAAWPLILVFVICIAPFILIGGGIGMGIKYLGTPKKYRR
jgi:hypothetical protein